MRRRRNSSWGDIATKAGVKLTSAQRSYLETLQKAVGFVITATSGGRTPEEQAAAMLSKLKAKGEAELRKVYRSNLPIIEEMLQSPRTVAAWAAVIREKGMGLSRHLFSKAVDLRTKNLTPEQVAKLKKSVTATGGRPYEEYDHLHVDLPVKYASASAAEEIAKSGARSATRGFKLVFGVGVAGIIAWVVWKRIQAKRAARAQLPS